MTSAFHLDSATCFRYPWTRRKALIADLLQQAQDAFIYGAPFAAIALMRAILEIVLSRHYGAAGRERKHDDREC